jgi:hypothetical protein
MSTTPDQIGRCHSVHASLTDAAREAYTLQHTGKHRDKRARFVRVVNHPGCVALFLADAPPVGECLPRFGDEVAPSLAL